MLDSKNLQRGAWYQSEDRLDPDVNLRETCPLHALLSWSSGCFHYLVLFYSDGAMQSWIFYPKMLFLPLMMRKAVKYQLLRF